MHSQTHCYSQELRILFSHAPVNHTQSLIYALTQSCILAPIHTRIHSSTHPRIHALTQPRTHASTHPRTHASTHSWSPYTCNQVTTHPHMYMHTSGVHGIHHAHMAYSPTYPILHQWPHTLRTYTPCTSVQVRMPSCTEPLTKPSISVYTFTLN